MPVGKRVYLRRHMPDPEVMKKFLDIPASNVADAMERNCAMNPRIHLVSKPKRKTVVGAAYTAKVRAGDNLAIDIALNYIGEGDILVISNEEECSRALLGEVIVSHLQHRCKAAAVVLDGPVRDIAELSQCDFPVYCTGTTPGGPYKVGPGEVNVPISCGGICVNPGDIILADPDGVIVIPRNDAKRVLADAQAVQLVDEKKVAEAKSGCADRAWVDRLAEERGIEILDQIYES